MRVCLPMQGTRVRALVWEDPTCCGAWAREPQLLSLRVWSLCSATREAAIVRGPRTAMKSGPPLPQLEKALAQKRRPNTAKKKKKHHNNTYYVPGTVDLVIKKKQKQNYLLW